jgi:glucose-1-phosphate adenylyltransferase
MSVDVLALILAGGRGSRLNLIAAKRAKPAVPFAGMYRIIDFTLSNCMTSGIRSVGVLTQYRPTSLMDHLGDGESWDLAGRAAPLRVMPPSQGHAKSDWYRGTADAVHQNLFLLRSLKPRNVLILSGDHIYRMDYRAILARHEEEKADLTLAAMEVPWEETHRFGVMICDDAGNVLRFAEKTRDRVSNLANMGVYVFRREVLEQELLNHCRNGRYDFGGNVIPGMLGKRTVISHNFKGYWRDVGTLQSYWEANMDALDPSTGLDLSDWGVRTNMAGRGQIWHPPANLGEGAQVRDALISRGCVIEGTVERSVLSPGVRVEPGATVFESVVMNDCVIQAGATVSRCILDKDVVIGAGARVGRRDANSGENMRFPTHLSGGITVVGKGTSIPPGLEIGANVLIDTNVSPDMFPAAGIPDGESLG